MSLRRQTFLIYGVEITEESFSQVAENPDPIHGNELYNKHKPRKEGKISIFYDGRSQNYIYLGVLLKKSNSTIDGPQNIGHYEFDESRIPNHHSQVDELVEEYELDTIGEYSFKLFTHVI
jgi:hypothetical protein